MKEREDKRREHRRGADSTGKQPCAWTFLSGLWANSKDGVSRKVVSEQGKWRKRTGGQSRRERNKGGGKKQQRKNKKRECSREEGEVESLLSVVTCSTERNNG